MRGLLCDKDRLWRSKLGPCGELGEGQVRADKVVIGCMEAQGELAAATRAQQLGSPGPGRGQHTWQHGGSL